MFRLILVSLQLSLGTALCLFASPLLAQVTPDGTVDTQVNQNGNVAEITGGETRGGNLFHSFQDFSVQTGNEAFFNNADSISNIFSRVTGGNISNIDGSIRANDTNLFLINPAGILFGENARLDVGGSFYGSTADSILFEDGEFSAVDNLQQPVLTINAPIGLSFRGNPGDITVRNDGNGTRLTDSEVIDTQNALRVDLDATIGLVGGNLLFEDATLKTAGGRIELGSVAEGTVNLVVVDNGFTFDYSGVEAFRDISLSGRTSIDASGLGAGNIQVAGRNITLRDISAFEANTLGGEAGGNISIFAANSIEISGVENELNFISGISNRVFSDGTADGGNINIEAGTVRIGDRAAVATSSSGRGNAGNININASDSTTIESQGNTSAILSNIRAEAVGNGGDINITTPSLALSNGALVSSNTSGQGNAGNINVNANETASLDGSGSGFFTNVRTAETVGNGGNINITTGSLNMSNQAVLDVSSSGQGNAGNVELNIGSLTLNNGTALRASNFANGRGGNVIINADENVSFSNESQISVVGAEGGAIAFNARNLTIASGSRFSNSIFSTTNIQDARSGNITINLTEDLVVDGLDGESFTSITNSSFGSGNSGDINIGARNITFQNGANVNSLATGENASTGNIIFNATDNIVFDGTTNIINADGNVSPSFSGILNSLSVGTTGNIGRIDLTAQNLILSNGASINSLVSGNGDSGDINIDVVNSVRVEGFGNFDFGNIENIPTAFVNVPGSENITNFNAFPSSISSSISPTGTGNVGSININTQNLALARNGDISASTFGQGNGGNININAEQITIGEQGNIDLLPSSIVAENLLSEFAGSSGNITINTDSLFISDGGQIEANIFGDGNGGNVRINASEIVSVDGSATVSSSEQQEGINISSAIESNIVDGVGNAGNIEIDTSRLVVDNNAVVRANVSNNSTGDSGSIIIRATESIEVAGRGDIEADVSSSSTGKGGNLTLETTKLIVSGAGQIGASTFGEGDAGNVNIRASESIELSGTTETSRGGLFASALINSGDAGNLSIFTSELIIRDGATINVGNFQSRNTSEPGTGEAGTLTIEANSIRLEDASRIEAATQSPTGEGANINLQVADNITLRDNSFISARAVDNADGGNLTIDTNFIVAFPSNGNGSDVIASAERGDGGNITIDAESLFGITEGAAIEGNNSNDIDASSRFSLDGTVTINTPDINPIQGATELPTNIIVPEETVAQACRANREIAAQNSFSIGGRGGLTPEPGMPLDSSNIYINGETDSTSSIPAPIETAQGKIQLARGVEVTESGGVILTAYRTNNAGERIGRGQNCDRVTKSN